MAIRSQFVKNDYLYYVDEEKNTHRLCRAITISRVLQDVLTKKIDVVIDFLDRDFNLQTILMPLSELEGGWTIKLTGQGFFIPYGKAGKELLQEILRMQFEDSAKVSTEFSHPYVGYHEVEQQRCFFGNKEASDLVDSTYSGKIAVTSKGTFEEWRDFLQEMLGQNPVLLLPLAMGASAPINTRLQMAGTIKETFLWALIGGTTTGKTTCMSLAASMWGKPTTDGLIDNLTGTQKYLFSALTQRKGFPFFLDETSVVNWDFTNVVYTIALSREGGRCNPDGTPKETKTWSGAVTFTGETSLFNHTNGNGGLHARLVEFDWKWFESNRLPDVINESVVKYYGTAWKPFVQHLESIKDAELIKLYKKKTDEFVNAIVATQKDENLVTGLKLRIAKKLEALLLAADLLIESWQIAVDREAVVTALVKAYDCNVTRIDKFEMLYEDLLAFFAQNSAKIVSCSISLKGASSCLGYEVERNKAVCVFLHAQVFETYLKKYGLDASKTTLKVLEERNILVRFGDRYKKPHGKYKERCYCINTDRSIDVSEDAVKAAKIKKVKKGGRQIHAANLFQDD